MDFPKYQGFMLQQLINGIITGSLYALIAVGLTMVYGILRILHIAHAAVYVAGAYLGLCGLFLHGKPHLRPRLRGGGLYSSRLDHPALPLHPPA